MSRATASMVSRCGWDICSVAPPASPLCAHGPHPTRARSRSLFSTDAPSKTLLIYARCSFTRNSALKPSLPLLLHQCTSSQLSLALLVLTLVWHPTHTQPSHASGLPTPPHLPPHTPPTTPPHPPPPPPPPHPDIKRNRAGLEYLFLLKRRPSTSSSQMPVWRRPRQRWQRTAAKS